MKETVSVINRGSSTFIQEHKGDTITIEAGKSIKMSRREAVNFVGSFGGTNKKSTGDHDKYIEKNLEIVRGDNMAEPEKFICQKDGKAFDTQAELDAHLKQYEKETFTDKAAEERIGENTQTSNESALLCPVCGRECMDLKELQIHLTSHKE